MLARPIKLPLDFRNIDCSKILVTLKASKRSINQLIK